MNHLKIIALSVAVMLTPVVCIAQGAGNSKLKDTQATVLELSPSGQRVELHGRLLEGYRVMPNDVVVHGESTNKQRYLFLHLEKPIDVLGLSPNAYSVFHQYDIQVVGPSTILDRYVGHDITIKGELIGQNAISGGPDWEPFPITISNISIRQGAEKP